MNKKYFNRTFSIITSIAVIIAALAVNIGASFLFNGGSFADMTDSKLYTISSETKRFNSTLDQKVTISIINADKSNAQFETFMKRYAESGENISLEYVNTTDDPTFLSDHGISSESGVNPYSVVVSSEKRSQYIDFYSMYYYSNASLGISQMSYSQYNYYYSMFSASESYADYLYSLIYDSELYFCGEKALTSTVEYVTLEYVPHSYFVTGHGEDDVYDGNFASLLSYMEYAYGVFDITSVDSVPIDADCIIINTPTEDYSDSETDIILDYLKSGGRMLLLTNTENLGMKNLMSIAEYYGATASAELISVPQDTEEDTEAESEADTEAEEEEYAPHSFSPVFNADHDTFAEFPTEYEVKVKNANPISIGKELRSALLVTPILTTSDKAYTTSAENKSVYNIGIAAEEETDEGNTRIVWLSCADTFNDKDSTSTDNMSLLVYAMSWMGRSYTSTLGEISAPLFEAPMLNVPSGTAVVLGILMIVIIPAALIATGVVIYVKRRKA